MKAHELKKIEKMQTASQMYESLAVFCDTILADKPYDPQTHMKMYSTCISYCQQSTSNPLKLYQMIQQKCVMKLKVLLKKSQGVNGVDALNFFVESKETFYMMCLKLSHVFSYLDRFFVKHQKAVNGEFNEVVFKHCMSLYWNDLLKANGNKVVQCALNLLTEERSESVATYRELISKTMRLFLFFTNPEMVSQEVVRCDVYTTFYQREYVVAANEYFVSLRDLFKNFGIAEFLQKTIEIIDLERDRLQFYVSSEVQREFWAILQSSFISEQCKFIIEKMLSLLRKRETDDLKKCFSVLKDGEKLQDSVSVFTAYCEEVGKERIENMGKLIQPFEIIKEVMEYYEDIEKLIKEDFGNHTLYLSAFGKVFRGVINGNKKIGNGDEIGSVVPEFLAKYSDVVIKQCVGIDELNERLDRIFNIYDYIENKDVFENYYIRSIAKRMLLRGNTANLSEENSAFGRHKIKFSAAFSFKIQKMMSDLQVSQDMSTKFTESVQVQFPFFVNILQTSVWPFFPQNFQFTLPQALQETHVFFEKWYVKQYQRRKLEWLHQYTRGKIKTNYLSKMYNFFGSAYQLSVLILFNSNETLTNEKIFEQIHLTMDIVKSVVVSLEQVGLIKVDNDVISLNTNFANNKMKIVLPLPKLIAAKEVKKEEEKEITAERVGMIEACIVKLMKRNRRMVHNELMQAVVTSLSSRFRPPVPLVKRTIESLIEREYMARSDVKKDEYTYIE
ncbi:cullin-2, putative [Entamoeba invadens IP1]|uniref:Cullin-2, putative n=1 Tax=Entamoeba invadens IP1 TaxID=370355 RepID=A0A0A1U181_ENTIV|nr:cullin-2, putative [Entamoeba invadens IP1]ELP86266.1 cullin-2, putative [Entamoeba invadens IP1]|eukprot:XP_004185612.1 cullin-2, putative [Entamoeba invadens IP1]